MYNSQFIIHDKQIIAAAGGDYLFMNKFNFLLDIAVFLLYIYNDIVSETNKIKNQGVRNGLFYSAAG